MAGTQNSSKVAAPGGTIPINSPKALTQGQAEPRVLHRCSPCRSLKPPGTLACSRPVPLPASVVSVGTRLPGTWPAQPTWPFTPRKTTLRAATPDSRMGHLPKQGRGPRAGQQRLRHQLCKRDSRPGQAVTLADLWSPFQVEASLLLWFQAMRLWQEWWRDPDSTPQARTQSIWSLGPSQLTLAATQARPVHGAEAGRLVGSAHPARDSA